MLELKGLSYQVEDNGVKTEILRGIDLTIEDNKFVVITGPNGGGKTTLAKTIMGLAKSTGGQIVWNGTDISGLSITEQARIRPPETGFALEGTRLSEVYLPRTAAPAEEL